MISVFKTSVKTRKQIKQLSQPLDQLKHIQKWNFDLSDCDNILRIESSGEISLTVTRLLTDRGYQCEELPE